jgi:hypothetical protein
MGVILSAKQKGEGKVVFELLMDYEEAVQLRGYMDNVRVFSESVSDMKTTISTRGKNASTKYFLIPRELRRNLKFDKDINCQKIELNDKIIFIYVVEKF